MTVLAQISPMFSLANLLFRQFAEVFFANAAFLAILLSFTPPMFSTIQYVDCQADHNIPENDCSFCQRKTSNVPHCVPLRAKPAGS